MVKKHCPKCGNYSYSAKTEGKWLCPTCGCDLSLRPALLLDQPDRKPEVSIHQPFHIIYKH